ncbi:SRPBCC domain-containing protein [Streptomyces phaeochromogenes]|uniref:SRPBCC domain-containing protein n=1 Tax=Streptomyces phaeochromogenes TaxID=1923 RepID=UPI002250CF8E|nr:SRPBCC domain-containing protein [Streptomyces phaeochromogenes]MCX5602916.1 SRPBCC domain-containing protein [Streptomyces phaeochromogenes]
MDSALTAVIDIDATPQAVWDVLTDFATYGEWSTFTSAEGTAHVGSRLTMRMPGMTFRPTITVATPGQELRWVGTLGTKRLFHGQHSFALSPNPDGTTRLTNHEEFSGALVTLTRRLLRTPKHDGYAAFNNSLKQQVEDRT